MGREAADYGSEVWGMVQCCKPDPMPLTQTVTDMNRSKLSSRFRLVLPLIPIIQCYVLNISEISFTSR